MQLFKLNHPHHTYPEQLTFNLKILEFVALFTRRHASLASLCASLGDDAIAKLYETYGELYRRRRDPLILEELTKNLSEEDVQRCQAVRRSWFCPTSLNRVPQTHNPDELHLPLDLLLPRFLELSAETVSVLDQEPGEIWLQLAATFMMRSAFEPLMPAFINTPRKNPTDYFPLDIYWDDASHIIACFAWGFIQPTALRLLLAAAERYAPHQPELESGEDFEQLVASAFRDERTDRELESWAATRREYLSFFICREGEQDEKLQGLDEGFPAAELDQGVMAFIEGIWKLVGSGSEHNKPVLVQIEEGHLNGLDDDEFKLFMRNIGGQEHLDTISNITLESRVPEPKRPRQQQVNAKAQI